MGRNYNIDPKFKLVLKSTGKTLDKYRNEVTARRFR